MIESDEVKALLATTTEMLREQHQEPMCKLLDTLVLNLYIQNALDPVLFVGQLDAQIASLREFPKGEPAEYLLSRYRIIAESLADGALFDKCQSAPHNVKGRQSIAWLRGVIDGGKRDD
ncbi:hypothetical protein I6M49_16850 [Shewanella algae]|uniref:hypothetical protein n=1 Tax=Shewanella algae TaxID=38313 RepID=UPI001AAC6B36|nr:hypothetical protein [Shewanella algae]MBO2655110.1 hypothetical protein [Shewanella algae]